MVRLRMQHLDNSKWSRWRLRGWAPFALVFLLLVIMVMMRMESVLGDAPAEPPPSIKKLGMIRRGVSQGEVSSTGGTVFSCSKTQNGPPFNRPASLQVPIPISTHRSLSPASKSHAADGGVEGRCLQFRDTFAASSIYGKATPWLGVIEVRAPLHKDHSTGAALQVHVVLTRSQLENKSVEWRESADIDEFNGVPLAPTRWWSDFIRQDVGPDYVTGVLAGPELVPLSFRRIKGTSEGRAPSIAYELFGSISRPGDYVLHMEHKFMNFGGLHDRDVYGAPYEPLLLIGAKRHNKMTRAGAVRWSKQKMKLLTHAHNNFPISSDGPVRPCGGQPHGAVNLVVSGMSVRGGRSGQNTDFQPIEGLRISTSFMGAMGPSVPCSIHNLGKAAAGAIASFLAGRYVVDRLLTEAPTSVIRVRGWNHDAYYPLSGVAYTWQPHQCRLVSRSFLLGESSTGAEARASRPSTEPGSGEVLIPKTSFGFCLARHPYLKKILFLGDSQVRTLFHTFEAVVEGREATISKVHYGHRKVDSIASGASQEGHIEIEFIWDPLLLNLSALSNVHARWHHIHGAAKNQRHHPKQKVVLPSTDLGNKKRRGGGSRSAVEADSVDWVEQEIAEDSDHVINTMEWEQFHFGPRSTTGASVVMHRDEGRMECRRTMNQLLQRSLIGVQTSGGASDVLRDDLLVAGVRNGAPNTVALDEVVEEWLVLGTGGWFGIHLWNLDDFEAHVIDIVDALVTLSAIRKQNGRSRPVIIFSGTPAWPSYVPWEGHRRNTNPRLGIMTQLLRHALVSETRLRVVIIPYFEMSLPMSHMKVHEKDIHYDGSIVPYTFVQYLATLFCSE